MFSLNFMFLCSFIEELCTKEGNNKTGCSFNFEHQCMNEKYKMIHQVKENCVDKLTAELKRQHISNLSVEVTEKEIKSNAEAYSLGIVWKSLDISIETIDFNEK